MFCLSSLSSFGGIAFSFPPKNILRKRSPLCRRDGAPTRFCEHQSVLRTRTGCRGATGCRARRLFSPQDNGANHTVGITLQNIVGTPIASRYSGRMCSETRLLLIEIDSNNFKIDGGAALQVEQNIQHGIGVFTPDRHTITRSPASIML